MWLPIFDRWHASLHHFLIANFVTRAASEPARLIIETLVLAVVYLAGAQAGLELDAVSGFATLVWPPSGIALAAFVLRGPKLWPGVAIGAFLANYLHAAPALAALGIAIGNTLEPLAGTFALRAIAGFKTDLTRVRDALGLIVFAALGSTLISATIGVASLNLTGVVADARIGITWRAWWIGDAIGVLVLAPVFLVWTRYPRGPWDSRRLLEAGALAVIAAATAASVFGSKPQFSGGLSAVYLLFPILIWAALRFGPRGAVTTGLLVSAIAIGGAAAGRGPFLHAQLHQTLFALQTFMGVQAATFLLLAASVAERRTAERDARAASAAKSEFLAVVSHELRTPLNAISGYAELLMMKLYGPLTDQQVEGLRRIQRSQRHLLTLIDDILGLAKLESGKLRFNPEPVAAADAFAEIEQTVKPELDRKDLRLTVSAPADVAVFADRERLRQVLLNVVSNAIKFTPAGDIAMRATRDGSGHVELKVSDTGIGIPARQLEHVFEPFVQAEHGPARTYPGVGLGLSVVRNLVAAMNGEVRIASEVGRGTIVSIVLPEAVRQPSDDPLRAPPGVYAPTSSNS